MCQRRSMLGRVLGFPIRGPQSCFSLLTRHCVRSWSACNVFPLAESLPSAASAAPWPVFTGLQRIVRPLLRYYALVRLPGCVRDGRTASAFPIRAGWICQPQPGSPGFRAQSFVACRGSHPTPQVQLAPRALRCPSCGLPLMSTGSATWLSVFGAQYHACNSPVNASPRPYGTSTHDSGPEWVATPSL
jgi:hypothetical protein